MPRQTPEKILAAWRRKYGAWKVTFIIEGYDDEFTYYVRGDRTREQAVAEGKFSCFRQYDEDHDIIHLKSVKKEAP